MALERQTARDGQLSPGCGRASAQYIDPVFAADLLAQAARPSRPALAPGQALPGNNSGKARCWRGRSPERCSRPAHVVLTYRASDTFPRQAPVEDLPYRSLAAAAPAGEATGCPGVPFQQPSNVVHGTQDVIDFFLSTPSAPYPVPAVGGARWTATTRCGSRSTAPRSRHRNARTEHAARAGDRLRRWTAAGIAVG